MNWYVSLENNFYFAFKNFYLSSKALAFDCYNVIHLYASCWISRRPILEFGIKTVLSLPSRESK